MCFVRAPQRNSAVAVRPNTQASGKEVKVASANTASPCVCSIRLSTQPSLCGSHVTPVKFLKVWNYIVFY